MSQEAWCLLCVTKHNVSNADYDCVGIAQALTISKIRILPVRNVTVECSFKS